MERWQRYSIFVLTGLVAGFGLFSIGFAFGQRGDNPLFLTGSGSAEGFDVVQEAYEQILSSAVDPPSEEDLARGAVRGMVNVLKKSSDDPYAYFYSPRGYRSLQELTTGKFSGVGVWLKVKQGDLVVVSVLPGTPALAAGLRRNDVIRSIDGQPVSQISSDEAVGLIKGPEGSEVRLGVERSGSPMQFRITRAEIELPNLKARMTAEDLGYIRLFGFADRAGVQLHKEVDDLLSRGAEGIILDLRDNGGGLFAEAIDVASVFIEDGEIVTYKDRETEPIMYDAEGDAFEQVPLVVLVNEGTASASEIVAGALQDRDRAILIGSTTYGKGSVQDVVPLADDSALKFTTAAYLTPSGHNINGKGIAPDVEVGGAPGVQFDRAVEILRGIVLSELGAQG
ncbi:MAG TPA: S41 family peptidase [Actinomycetota bacterium]|nr:S41 family peptidase [Actinomycetota bacterium]